MTALTAQNTRGVASIHVAPPAIVRAQIDAVLEDFDVRAIKIGMLGSAEVVEVVAASLPSPLAGEGPGVRGRRASASPETRALRRDPSSGPSGHLPPQGGKGLAPFVIYDPVMVASSGDALAGGGFVAAVKARLLPRVDCLTPNLAEAAALLGEDVAANEDEMAAQGRALLALGPRAVLMKGGHLAGDEAVDLLVTTDGVRRFAAPRLASPNLHGTGCTLSSAIAAHIALGADLVEAVAAAKDFVGAAIERGRDVKLGDGRRPADPISDPRLGRWTAPRPAVRRRRSAC